MNKAKAFIVLGGTTNAQLNKALTAVENNQNSDIWQFVAQEQKNICLACRIQCKSTEKLEVFVLRNRKTVICFSLYERFRRNFNKSSRHLRMPLDPVKQSDQQAGREVQYDA